jgi:hypothetical protein
MGACGDCRPLPGGLLWIGIDRLAEIPMPRAPTVAAPLGRKPRAFARNVADHDEAARLAGEAAYLTVDWDGDAWKLKAEDQIARAYGEEALEGVVHPGL